MADLTEQDAEAMFAAIVGRTANVAVQNLGDVVSAIVARHVAAARVAELRAATDEQKRLSTGPLALGNKAVQFKRLLFANWLDERADRIAAEAGL